jgi:hypothetical protein
MIWARIPPALLACAGDLVLGLPPAALFTRLRCWAASCSHQTCASACSPRGCPGGRTNRPDNPGRFSRANPLSPVRFSPVSAARTLSRYRTDAALRRSDASPEVFCPLQRLPAAMRCPGRPSLRTIPLRRSFTSLRPARPRTFADWWRPCGFSLLGCDAVVLDVGTLRRLRSSQRFAPRKRGR